MEWSIVITLLSLGLLFVVAEVIFVPGTTVVGFIGIGFLVFGIALSFLYFGIQTGWLTLGGSAVVSGLAFYFSFRSDLWGRFALRSSIKSKVNEGSFEQLSEGQEGVALSALRPVGKGEWDERTYEVRTNGEYIERGTRIKIIRISFNQIFVEPTS